MPSECERCGATNDEFVVMVPYQGHHHGRLVLYAVEHPRSPSFSRWRWVTTSASSPSRASELGSVTADAARWCRPQPRSKHVTINLQPLKGDDVSAVTLRKSAMPSIPNSSAASPKRKTSLPQAMFSVVQCILCLLVKVMIVKFVG